MRLRARLCVHVCGNVGDLILTTGRPYVQIKEKTGFEIFLFSFSVFAVWSPPG